VYGALSSHRQPDPAKFTMPLFAPRLIYSTATGRLAQGSSIRLCDGYKAHRDASFGRALRQEVIVLCSAEWQSVLEKYIRRHRRLGESRGSRSSVKLST
jgi:hypothetical protein